MTLESGLRTACLSGIWVLNGENASISFQRPSDGSVIELDDVDPDIVTSICSVLRAPTAEADLDQALAALGDSAAEMKALLEAEGVVRWRTSARISTVSGDDPLQEIVMGEIQRCGWAVAAIHCFVLGDLLTLSQPPIGAAVAMSSTRDCLVAVGLGCMHCLALRTLGVVGERGEDQTHLADFQAGTQNLQALVAAALAELEGHPLASDEGLLIRLDQGLERGHVLAHPDCPACAAQRARLLGPDFLRRDLAISAGRSTSASQIQHVFGASPFSPLRISDASHEPSLFPFESPFVSGDTCLTRFVGRRLFCTSIASIAHGSAPSADHSRLLAWSEGVERLGAQSARADISLSAKELQTDADNALYGWFASDNPQDRFDFCFGVDLLRDSDCLVPLERVGVSMPDERGYVVEPNFSGTASHVTSMEAVLHATVELLKREAFIVAWYRRRRLRRVAWPASLPVEVAARVTYLQKHGLDLKLFDLRLDIPLPTLLLRVSATRGVGNWPAGGAFLVPAGGFTPESALDHALGLACTRFAGVGLDESPERNPLDADAVARLAVTMPAWPGLVRYLDPAESPKLDFVAGNEVISMSDIAAPVARTPVERFQLVRDWLSYAGMNWLCVSLTNPDMLTAGLRVVKVVIPEAVRFTLHPADVDRSQVRLMKEWSGTTPGSWNESPHPLY